MFIRENEIFLDDIYFSFVLCSSCKFRFGKKVNMQNITKNNVEPQKSALKPLRGILWCSVFSIYLVFINLFSNNTSVAIKSCSLLRFKMIIQESFSYFLILNTG